MSKKRINSCRKGKGIERKACHHLAALGFPAQRGARNGVKAGPDIICPSLDRLHIEVKGDERIDIGTVQLQRAMMQSMNDATHGQTPVVLWKRKHGTWRVSRLDPDDQIATYRADDKDLWLEWNNNRWESVRFTEQHDPFATTPEKEA